MSQATIVSTFAAASSREMLIRNLKKVHANSTITFFEAHKEDP